MKCLDDDIDIHLLYFAGASIIMSTSQNKYFTLIAELRKIQMIKNHVNDLKSKLKGIESELPQINREIQLLVNKIDKLSNRRGFGKLWSSFKKSPDTDLDTCKDLYHQNMMLLKEKEELMSVLQYEIKILEEKCQVEEELNQQIFDLIQDEEEALGQSASISKSKEIIGEISMLVGLQSEFDELIDAGKEVLEIVDKIENYFDNKLIKSVRLKSLSSPFKTYCSDTIISIEVEALNLGKMLKSFSNEYDDVYENKEWKEMLSDYKYKYYNTLTYGELIISKVTESDVSESVRSLVKKMSTAIKELNAIFRQELEKVKEQIVLKNEAFQNHILSK